MKKLISLVLCVIFALSTAVPALAADVLLISPNPNASSSVPVIKTDYGCADMLYSLSLLKGKGNFADGSVNFDMKGSLTRAEAIVQVIRFLGVEKEVTSGSFAHPFTDVPDWANNYIGYAYTNKITSGTGATTFSPSTPVSAAQFTTLMLRAIGYSDANGDFSWDNPFNLSKLIGMTRYSEAPKEFVRGDAFRTCMRALYSKAKSGEKVYTKLIDAGVFTLEELNSAAEAARDKTEPVQEGFYVISEKDYLDKTTAGFLSQLAGFFSGYEFVRSGGALVVGMPEDWYEFLAGPYAGLNPYSSREDRLTQNSETGMWEIWMDDDYSIDILDQYILRDMYNNHGVFTSKVITDGWANYDVYDMGGGNRYQGAYALAKNNRYLPEFCGSAEFGNKYSALTEPWIGNEMTGMNAAGLPNLAVKLADTFGSVTGDRENVEWTKYVTAMYAMAYFESDVPTIIVRAANVFGEKEMERDVIDLCFELYEKHPDDWQTAMRTLEKTVLRRHDRRSEEGLQLELNVNNGLMILGMLYGDGDYDDTCKYISLGGYDGDCTAAVGLGVLGVIKGMAGLPEKVNEMLWQNGKGYIINRPIMDMDQMYWMCMFNLPEKLYMADIINMYRDNFVWLLKENGGRVENGNYYIPSEEIRTPDVLYFDDFESGSLDGYTVSAGALVSNPTYEGENSLKVDGGEAFFTVSGLKVGQKYRFLSFVLTDKDGEAEVFARAKGESGVFATVQNYSEFYIKRELVFTATAETMEIGIRVGKGAFALIDRLPLYRIDEVKAGEVKFSAPSADNTYKGTVNLEATTDKSTEVLLKLGYANNLGNILNVAVMVNGVKFNTVPLAMTGADVTGGMADFAYVPVVLKEGTNKISLIVGRTPVTLTSVELVTLTETY